MRREILFTPPSFLYTPEIESKYEMCVGLCMGHGNTELIRKTEPKLSRTENTVDFLTLSEPNRTGKIFWYGFGSYMLSIPRTVPNCTELKNRN